MTFCCPCDPDRCPCPPGRIAIPPWTNPQYEATLIPARAARNTEITNLNHGIAVYPRQTK